MRRIRHIPGIIPARAGFTGAHSLGTLIRRDHPRSRGVYAPTMQTARSIFGSSPLARGLRGVLVREFLPRRIIPARAGFTAGDGMARTMKGGSSPLARGLPRKSRLRARRVRIIPARAGFTGPLAPMLSHPPGSSPLARGLHQRQSVCARRPGIIPARAGFTGPSDPYHPCHPDHPRSRGVYSANTTGRSGSAGSSPLARGLRTVRHGHGYRVGIIPARAGFTCGDGLQNAVHRDHPRSRGVYQFGPAPRTLFLGSSPLARGLPAFEFVPVNDARIIPARAGFTRVVGTMCSRCADHPRSRGVYTPFKWPSPHFLGSSPLARGLPEFLTPGDIVIGIIPARAGFT